MTTTAIHNNIYYGECFGQTKVKGHFLEQDEKNGDGSS
jgi:hypothetical protein